MFLVVLHPSSARLGSWGIWISSYGKESDKMSCINFSILQNSQYIDLHTCDLKNFTYKMEISKKLCLFFNSCRFLKQIKLIFSWISAQFQLNFSSDSRGAQLGLAQLEKFLAPLASACQNPARMHH